MNILAIALISIVLSVLAQFALKAGMSSIEIKEIMAQPFVPRTFIAVISNTYVFFGFSLYGLGAVVWLSVLSKWDVSKAYPLVGLGFAMTVAVGFVLGEQVTLLRATGVALICLGVFLVART